MVIDQTHRKWALYSVAGLGVAILAYIPYAEFSRYGPKGGSAMGLVYGIIGFGFMLYAGLLGARRQVPGWRIGRAKTWMRAHLWLGLLSFPLILLHSGFSFGSGSLTVVLMWLFLFVTLSGLVGAAIQHFMPTVMTRQVPKETIFEQIDNIRTQLREEAEELIKTALAPKAKPAPAAAAPAAAAAGAGGGAAVAAAPAPAAAGVGIGLLGEVLREFQERELNPFLMEPKQPHPLDNRDQSKLMFEQLRKLVPGPLKDTVDSLEDICEEERQLRRQETLHWWMHGWLLVHIPLSYAVLLLGAIHAVVALRY